MHTQESGEGFLRLPRAFLNDHEKRLLPTPEYVRETERYVWVRRNDPDLPEVINDAQFYADPSGPECEGEEWIVAAAKRLLLSIERQGIKAWKETYSRNKVRPS